MYLIDFFKRITRKSNIPVIIYLVLNVFIIGAIISMLFGNDYAISLLGGLLLYLVSLVIALSPLGEWILRMQTGCRKIKRVEQIQFLEPIFREVYDKARNLDPSIPNNVRLYINEDASANAFATGRKTICVTNGLLHMPEAQIKAVLGHELGHLAHKDTDLILVVSVGNMIVSLLVLGIRIIIEIAHLVLSIVTLLIGGREGFLAAIIGSLYRLAITAIISGLMWIWTKIGTLLVMKSSRENEYEADAFSFNLGYGNELCVMLDSVGSGHAQGLFANLASSHPDKNERIARLQAMGATYRATFRGK